MPEEKLSSKVTAIRFTESMHKEIAEELRRLHLRKTSDLIRMAIAEYFENHKDEIEGKKK